MNFLIPILSGVLYRLGGSEHGNKWYRWLLGLPIAIITHNWWYLVTYFVATNMFSYGDNSLPSKILGRKGARVLHGLTFGLASLHPIYALWTAAVFYILFEIAEHNVIDNKYAEFGRGCLGTLMLAWG